MPSASQPVCIVAGLRTREWRVWWRSDKSKPRLRPSRLPVLLPGGKPARHEDVRRQWLCGGLTRLPLRGQCRNDRAAARMRRVTRYHRLPVSTCRQDAFRSPRSAASVPDPSRIPIGRSAPWARLLFRYDNRSRPRGAPTRISRVRARDQIRRAASEADLLPASSSWSPGRRRDVRAAAAAMRPRPRHRRRVRCGAVR